MSIGFLPKDITRRVIITDDNYVTIAFCFGTAYVLTLLPYHLSIVTRVIPVGTVECLAVIILFFVLPRKTLLLTYGVLFSLDRCLLNG